MSNFKYINPVDNGFRRVQLSRADHNALFPRRKTRWCHRYEIYLSDRAVELHRFTSILGILVMILSYPLNVLFCGFGNLKELNRDYRGLFNEKEAGAYSSDYVADPEMVELVRTRSNVV